MARAAGDVSEGDRRGAAPLSRKAARRLLFGTVGTDHHPFDRLVEWIDRWMAEGPPPDLDCFIQYGASRPPRRARGDAYVVQDEMSRRIAQADVIICHGGPGTIIGCLRAGKKPIVVPRTSALGEHVDDHQIRFCTRMDASDLIELVRSEEDLGRMLDAVFEGSMDLTAPDIDGMVGETTQRVAAILDGLRRSTH